MHKTRKICFTLSVDNFAIKYTKLEDAQHLIDALKNDYTITIDWDATKYIGLTIKWDYAKGKVHAHMPGYLPKAYYDSIIRNQRRSRTCHTHTLHLNMELRSNTHQMPTTPPPSTKRRPNTYRQLQEPSYIMDRQLTIPFSLHSVRSRPNRRNQQKEQKKH